MALYPEQKITASPSSVPNAGRPHSQEREKPSPLPLILASSSPRRQELIALLGIPFLIVPSRYVEPPPPREPVCLPELVMELARQKVLEVAARAQPGWVLGADTLVSLEEGNGVPLGKPADREDARRMLTLLSGRTHYVYTGIALAPSASTSLPMQPACTAVRTGVRFREMSQAMIEDYLATGEPMDKAGAYGAQGYASPFIEGYDGDFFNVVGLPVCETARLLEKCGMEWWKNRDISA